MSTTRIVVVSGYFSPCHAGHVELFRAAKEFAGEQGQVWVIINNDDQAILKRGLSAVPIKDRAAIVSAMRYVDRVVPSIDKGRSVCDTLESLCKESVPPTHFANAGDRSSSEVPEKTVCDAYHVDMVDLPGDKINSSSDMIKHILNNQHLLKW